MTRPAPTVTVPNDWSEYQDDISDAISDSMDVDWSASVGARAVVAWLNEHRPLVADTSRVTVPVEPEYTATDYLRLIAEGWEVIESTGSQMTIQNPEDDGPQDLVIDVDAMLSAAPAPEGGAVSETELRDAIALILPMAKGYAAAHPVGSNQSYVDYVENLITTREEAPAEAGEIGAEYDDAAHCVTLAACPPGLFLWNGTLGFKSEYGAMEPVGISPHHQQWKVGNRVDAYCADSGEYFWGGTSNHDDRAKLLVYPISAEAVAMVASHGPSAIRAQPQAREARDCGNGHQPGCDCDIAEEDVARSKPPAREDAQPVASAYRVRPEMNDPEEWTLMHPERAFDYLDRPGWETQPLYTHPAPDALRVAVEALEKIKAGVVEVFDDEHQCNVEASMDGEEASEIASQALAALQAEQKGGA